MNVAAKRELAAQLALRHPSELEARYLAAKVPGFLMDRRVPDGELPGYRIGQAVRFDPDEILELTRREAPAARDGALNAI